MNLYPVLFRRLLFPALDALNGTRVSRTLAFLEASQWYPEERLRELQARKLRALLDWTGSAAGFYRRFWREAGEERRAASQHPALDGLPVVTKDDLRAAAAQFPPPAFRGRILRVQTSGSTGRPMTFLRSAAQESWFWALRLRMWQWGGYVPGEPYLTLNLNPRTAWRKRLQDVLFRCSYHGFNANRRDVDAVLRDLERRRVRCLVGYASSLYLLAEEVRRRGASVPPLRGILATGDTLFPGYRRTIEETFGAGVVDYYGAGGEGLHLASQCEERGLYHLHVEGSVVEVLKDGRPARPGEMGEVVVTQLDNRAMPLVRYATQDVAVAADPERDGRCACGRALPLLAAIQGRVPDIVRAPDGSALVVHFFTILFEHLPGIRQFQVRQRELDRITVRLVAGEVGEDGGDGAARAVEPAVRAAVARATAGSLAVDFEYVEDIPLAPSQKRRLVISELGSAPGLAATLPAGPDPSPAPPAPPAAR